MVNYLNKIAFILFLFVSVSAIGQQRIGMDISTRLNNLNFTFNYQKVWKKNILLSGGIFFGKFGSGGADNTYDYYYNGYRYTSPFDQVNEPIIDTSGSTLEFFDYMTKGSGFGIQIGTGYFHEFSVVHGIRLNLNYKLGYMKSLIIAGYYSPIDNRGTYMRYTIRHFTAAISPEIYHTIRLGGRTTFYYGLKFPYYHSITKKSFNPLYASDLFKEWEPELSIGLSHSIGKCD